MASVAPKLTASRPSHPVDNPIRTIEYAMQELVSLGASSGDVDASASYVTNDADLVTAIKASLSARTS